MYIKYFYIIGILILSSIQTYSQKSEDKFYNLEATNELPNNSIMTITQDHKGFMWFGTYQGLCRYDAHQLRTFEHHPEDSLSLSSSHITTLLTDKKGRIWVGTRNGLNLWNPTHGSFKRYLYEKTSLESNKRLTIRSIFEDRESKLWVGTSKGLYLKDKSKSTFEKLQDPLTNAVPSAITRIAGICQDNAGSIYVAAGRYIVKYSKEGKRMAQFDYGQFSGNEQPDDYIRTIAIDAKQRIWIGGQKDNLVRFNCYTGKFEKLNSVDTNKVNANNIVYQILIDPDNGVWTAGKDGISHFDGVTGEKSNFKNIPENPNSLADNHVLSIFRAKDGIFWVGTYNSGVQYILPNDNRFHMISSGKDFPNLSYNVVSSVSNEKKELWVSTTGGGVSILNWDHKQVTSIPALRDLNVTDVVKDQYDNIWASSDGLWKLNPAHKLQHIYRHDEKDSNSLASNNIYKILPDSQGRLWVATTHGLDQLDYATNRFKHIKIGEGTFPVLTLFEDSKGNLWIGGPRSLVYILKKGDHKVVRVPMDTPRLPEKGSVFSFHEDINGNIWIGGNEIGLKKYNPERKVIEEYHCEGLYSKTSTVINIESDRQGRLWLGMVNDIVMVDVKRRKATYFGKADGISITEFTFNSSFKDNRDWLYFGTNKGVLYFDPESINVNNNKSEITLTGLEVNGKLTSPGQKIEILETEISESKTIELQHNQNFFKVSFALLNYIHPQKNMYEYRLEGVHPGWQLTPDPWVTFNNLAPGTYNFLVRGFNNDGIISANTIALKIVILPPWWQSWWAYLIYGMILLTVTTIMVRLLWARTVLNQTLQLHQAKMNFFTNISHEIRTHLTLIAAPLDKSLSIAEPESLIHYNLVLARTNSSKLLALVTELLDFRRLDSKQVKLHVKEHDIVKFATEVLRIFENQVLEKGITVQLNVPQTPVLVLFDAFQLEKALFNLLSNAFKFVEQDGHIELNIQELEKEVWVEIIDDGKGIAPEFMDKLFENYFQIYEYGGKNTGYGIGLPLSKEIVMLHGGLLVAESSNDEVRGRKRTCFRIKLLKGENHFTAEQLKPLHETGDMVNQAFMPAMNQVEWISDSASIKEGHPETILIAEDNPELRNIIAICMQQYHVIQSANGQEAWEQAQEFLPDLIITDLLMPELNGVELCHRIKQSPLTCHIPVVMLTAKGTNEHIIKGLQAQADHYLTKPFDITELALKVSNLLRLVETVRSRAKEASTITEMETGLSNELDKEFLNKMVRIIEENMKNDQFGVDQFAREMGLGRSVLYKKVKAVTGMSVNDFVKMLRFQKATRLLKTNVYNINEVSELVGFNDRKYFTREFAKIIGKTPSQYMKDYRTDSPEQRLPLTPDNMEQ